MCYNQQTMKELIDDGRIKFGLTGDSSPKRKLFLNERLEKGDKKTPSSLLLDAGTTKSGTTEIMSLFGNEKVFDYPKPTSLLTKLISYIILKIYILYNKKLNLQNIYVCDEILNS